MLNLSTQSKIKELTGFFRLRRVLDQAERDHLTEQQRQDADFRLEQAIAHAGRDTRPETPVQFALEKPQVCRD